MLGNEGNLKTLSCENILGRELNDVEKSMHLRSSL